MNFNSSLKKIVCFLLAVLMILSVAGCKDSGGKKKKKVIVRKKVIVKSNDDNSGNDNQNGFEIDFPDGDEEVINTDSGKKKLSERPLPMVSTDEGYVEWVEPVVPEFDYDYTSLNITSDYVIVYALENWQNRYESRNRNGSDRQISTTGFARMAARELKTYFKDKLKLDLDVKKDTEVASNAKKILVGDTAYYKTNLAQTEFGVKVKGDDLIFEGGHFAMVSKAVKWYESLEVKSGKVAVLNGKCEDFKSQVTIDGVTYDYIWGDEFDGSELNNNDKWFQKNFGLERQDDMANIFNDSQFQYIENGRLRLTGDRYYDESDGTIGYATSGEVSTNGIMLFRNGYFEFRARIPYRRGAFPAIWTVSNSENKQVPNWNYNDGYGQYSKRFWTIEFDLFESFADSDHMTTTIHKWYNNNVGAVTYGPATALTEDQVNMVNNVAVQYGYANSATDYYGNATKGDASALTRTVTDADGNEKTEKYYYPIYLNKDSGRVDIFNYRKRPFTNMTSNAGTYAYSFTYSNDYNTGNVKNGNYNWTYYFDPETLNNEYHIYAFSYTQDHCSVFVDGNKFLDFDWDPAFDYRDVNGDGIIEDISDNNNGVGFNLWHEFLIDMMIYTPNNFKIDYARKIQKGDTPFNLYVDWVRCYQDLDDPSQALWFPNGQGD